MGSGITSIGILSSSKFSNSAHVMWFPTCCCFNSGRFVTLESSKIEYNLPVYKRPYWTKQLFHPRLPTRPTALLGYLSYHIQRGNRMIVEYSLNDIWWPLAILRKLTFVICSFCSNFHFVIYETAWSTFQQSIQIFWLLCTAMLINIISMLLTL